MRMTHSQSWLLGGCATTFVTDISHQVIAFLVRITKEKEETVGRGEKL